MAQNAANVTETDRLREQLEDSIAKLRDTLKYWQTWEAEYEGFKEELELLEEEPSQEQMVEISMGYGGDVINENEIKDIVNLGKKPPRSRSQVISLLSGRVETGRKNTEIIQKQIDKVEDKLNEVLVVSRPSVKNEDGEEMMEIIEELDESGNIISSNVSNFDQSVDQMKGILQKSRAKSKQKATDDNITPDRSQIVSRVGEPLKTLKPSNHAMNDPPVGIPRLKSLHNMVSDEAKNHSTELKKGSSNSDKDELSIAEESGLSNALVTSDVLDAQKEMRRNLRDIGPVVATLNLADSDEGQWSSEEESDEDEDEDEENSFGMNNIKDEISKDYIKKMEDLMKTHSLSQEGMIPSSKSILNTTKGRVNEKGPSSSNPKGVRFAESLDIAPSLEPSINATSEGRTASETVTKLNPISEIVTERKPSQRLEAHPPFKRVSRFKAAREFEAHSLEETEPTNNLKVDQEAENPTEDLLKNEFVLYRERMSTPNQQIDRRLFKAVNQEENVDLDEVKPKISKFKAARLGYIDDNAQED